MPTEKEHWPETGRRDGAGKGDASDVDASSPEERTQQWVRDYEKERLEVAEQIARGALEALVEQLMDDDEDKRYDMARHIARGGQTVIPRAIELAEDARPRMREMACYILGQVGCPDPDSPGSLIRYPEGIPTLLGCLEHDIEPDVRAAAAAALGHQSVPTSLPALCRAAADPCSEVRFDVACALGSFYEDAWETEEGDRQRETVVAALLRLMDDEDEDVRDWATFGIHQGGHDTPEVRARLWQALDDPNPEVRGEAARGLGLFGDRSLIPRLEKLLRDDPAISPNYFEAAEALGDPCLLPAVLEGAERWRQTMKEGEELHFCISSAIEVLQKPAAGEMNEESGSDTSGCATEAQEEVGDRPSARVRGNGD